MKQLYSTINYLTLSALLAFTACEGSSIEPDNLVDGPTAFPIAQGDFQIYSVYDIRYNFATANDTLEYEMKHAVVDAYLDAAGDSTYVVQLLSRFSETANWQLDSISRFRRTAQRLVETSNNRPVVKLIFPVRENLRWNSNMLNNQPADTFYVESIQSSFSTPTEEYTDAISVIREDLPDPIVATIFKQDVYAAGLGLVYQEDKVLNFCAETDCVGQGIITSGRHVRRWLKERGRNPE